MTLGDYVISSPTTAHSFIGFTVQINSCQVTALNSDIDSSVTYSLGTPVVYKPYTVFTENGTSCGYTINYSTSWLTYYGTTLATLPPFVTWNHANTRFEALSTSDTDLTTAYQTYAIQLKGAIPLLSQNPEFSKT